jgi:flagellar FliJ protein
MSSEHTVTLLIERAREAYDAASQDLGRATAQRDRQQQQLQMLVDYHSEYRSRLEEHAGRGLTVAELVNYQRFLGQLEQAVDQQRGVQLRAEQGLESARQHWQIAHRRLKSFEILQERRSAAGQRVLARREQRDSDATAQRIAQSRKLPF